MNDEKQSSELIAEILHELSSMGLEDLECILQSWKATLEANKDNGDWGGYHFILCQNISPQTAQGRSSVPSS